MHLQASSWCIRSPHKGLCKRRAPIQRAGAFHRHIWSDWTDMHFRRPPAHTTSCLPPPPAATTHSLDASYRLAIPARHMQPSERTSLQYTTTFQRNCTQFVPERHSQTRYHVAKRYTLSRWQLDGPYAMQPPSECFWGDAIAINAPLLSYRAL